ncbi:PadR family transcriptional regulator [Halopelagius fulvigenes]|uniref:PadR family transcriptional regulator n=1 Tax=Halopelagius fulvigenes TaxID=1198324 RepID=A0ABD5U4I4_9EURY
MTADTHRGNNDCPNDTGGTEAQEKLRPTELRDFQQNILTILADGPQHGLGVKADLEDYYGEDVNHGRLYPNLDELVEGGFISKSELDKRTNEYELTEKGRSTIDAKLRWMAKKRGVSIPVLEGAGE